MNSENKAKIREAREAIEKARAKVEKLCDGKEHWRMSVPARPNDDPDLVISDALFKADEALALLDAEDKPIPEPAPAERGKERADPLIEASNDDWDEFDSMEDWADWNSTGLHNGLFCLTKWPKDKTDAAIAQLDMIYEYTMRVMSRALAARPQPKESAKNEKALREAAGAFLKDMETLVSSSELLQEALRLAELGQPLTLTDQLSTRLRVLLAHESPKEQA